MNDLLKQYAKTADPDVFASLVRMYVDAVYSQCLRQMHNQSAAEEVAQQVFVILARKAAVISRNTVLEGWLFNTTRYCCANAKRTFARRRKAEQKAALMRREMIQSNEPITDDIRTEAEGMLDDAIANLGERDRDAVLLRFMQGRSMREVGAAMGVSEDAAKQRVFRAVEKLRLYFGRRGLVAPTATVAAWLETSTRPAGSHVAQDAVALASAKASVVPLASSLGLKVAASIVAAALLTGGTLAANYTLLADGAPAAAAQAPTPPPPAMTAAAKPGGQDTPIAALKKLSNSIKLGDIASVDACLSDGSGDPGANAAVRAVIHSNSSIYRMKRAWMAVLKQPMQIPNIGLDIFPGLEGGFETLLDKSFEINPSLQAKVDGDVATVGIPITRETFTAGRPASAPMGKWSGAHLVLKRIDGQWKLDLNRTITMQARADTDDPMVAVKIINEAMTTEYAKVAASIEKGEITTAEDAVSAVIAASKESFRAAGVNGDNIAFLPGTAGD